MAGHSGVNAGRNDRIDASTQLTVHIVGADPPEERVSIKEPIPVPVQSQRQRAHRFRYATERDTSPPSLPLFDMDLVEAPYYYPVNELTKKPQASFDPSLDLANSLRHEPPRSTVIRLRISEQGLVDQVINEESTFSEDAQRRVREAFARMKFRPGELNGSPVRSELRIEILLEEMVSSTQENMAPER